MFIMILFVPGACIFASVFLWSYGQIAGWLAVIFAIVLIVMSFSLYFHYLNKDLEDRLDSKYKSLEEEHNALQKKYDDARAELNDKEHEIFKMKSTISGFHNYERIARRYATLDSRKDRTLSNKTPFELRQEIRYLMQKVDDQHNFIKNNAHTYSVMLSGQLKAFPYLAGMIADYKTLEDHHNNNYHGISMKLLERKLKITDLIREKKELIAQQRETAYKLDFLFAAFPELEDFLDMDYRHISNTFDYHDHDPAKDYLSKEEWETLSPSDRNQLALDRYIENHNKTKWQIGRDYEMSVGHSYLQQGFKVDFTGATQKFDDLGRDLLAQKGSKVYVIQCKYWSHDKVIHEKHIFQLYGTSHCYQLDHPTLDVQPVFVTNIDFSFTAKKFAKSLGVILVKNHPLEEFPRIKCNIGHSEDGTTMIYHLPMDQQYDTVVISKPGECYARTVEEAEQMGFRRAYKWHS